MSHYGYQPIEHGFAKENPPPSSPNGLPSPTRPALPNAITFVSQEDFENAVMEVIMKRLCIHSHEAYIQVGDFGSSC